MSSSDSALPPEKLQELRKAVKEQLKSLGVNEQIKSLVAENKNYKPVKGKEGSATQQQAIDELKGRGVIDQLVKSLNCTELIQGQGHAARSHGKQCLQIAVRSVNLKANTAPPDQLFICGELFGQRFRTAPVAAAVAQALEASVFIELPAIPTADPATLLTLRHPLHLVLLGTQNQLLPSTSGHHSLSASPQPSTSPINIAQASSSGQGQGSAPGHSGWTHGARNEAAARSVHATGTLPGTLTMLAPHAAPATFITTGSRGPDRSSTATTAAHAADSMAANRSVSLIGTGYAEWRTVLASRAASCSVAVDLIRPELGGNGTEVVANVKLDLTMSPVLPHSLEGSGLKAQLQLESNHDTAAMATFSEKVRAWSEVWTLSDSAVKGHEANAQTVIKGEDGVERPCCAFVRPLQLGRALSTAHKAARFVALLGTKAGSKGEQVAALHTMIASRQASQEEKALLLASLLAGFGFEAWVAYGTDAVGWSAWALTRSGKESVTIWNPTSGTCSSPHTAGQPKGCPYRSLSLVFNHRKVFANLHSEAGIADLAYHLEDEARWRELTVSPQTLPGPATPRFDLQMHPCDLASHELRLESELRRALSEHRQEALGHTPTHWDDNTAFLLMSSLAAYEQEALTGQPAAQEDFQQCIRRNIPSGCTFKGFPQHHRTLCTSLILKGLLKETPAQDILGTQAPDVSFAIRVKVFQYPEQVFSVWLMLAMKCPGHKRFSRSSQ